MKADQFPVLRRLWIRLTEPLVTLTDEDSRQRVSSQASLLLIGAVMLLAIIPFTYFAGAPGSTFTTRLLADGSCTFIFLIGYTLSRYNRLQLAVICMIFPASIVIIVISIVTETYGYLMLFFLSIPVVVSGLFAAVNVTITLVIFDTFLVLFCKIALGLFDADVLISPIIFNLLLAFFIVTTIENRRLQIDRYNLRLRQSEARYRALIESVKDILFTVSPQGEITSLNAAVTAISGWQIEDLTGKHFLKTFHPEDQARIKDTFHKIMSGARPPRIEARLMTKDGQYRWMELSASAINVEGLHGMSGVARDISARKAAETALQESRQRLSLFVEQMPLALIEWDARQNIIAWNSAAEHIFSYSIEEARQFQGAEFLMSEADKPRFKAVFADVYKNKVFRISTADNLTKDGRKITCDWVNIPLVDESGKLLGVAAMAEDITERVSSQQQQMKLLLTQERLGILQHFLSSISHDFRTSLAQIETNRYLIERAVGVGETEKVQQRLKNISFSVQHLVSQIENLNMISSLGQLQLKPVNLNLFLSQLVSVHQSAADAKNLRMQCAFEDNLPLIPIDSDKLQTALKHLLKNAITYTPDGESITVSTENKVEHAHIHIMDTGQGIDQEDQDHIFDLFYRADKARSLETGGVGVGLSIARMIAEAHGGSLSVISERGQGSTFTLTLPLIQPVETGV